MSDDNYSLFNDLGLRQPQDNDCNDRRSVKKRKTTDKITPEFRKRIIDDYLSGLSQNQIKEKYGYSGNGTVWRVIRDYKDSNPKPVRQPGETKYVYAVRVKSWKMKTNPRYSISVRKNMSAAMKRRFRGAKVSKVKNVKPVIDLRDGPVAPNLVPVKEKGFFQKVKEFLFG